MSAPNERDEAVVRWIAAYLDVELMPWQDHFLRLVMAYHREEPASPPEVVAVCSAMRPGRISVFCKRPAGHTGVHDSDPENFHDGDSWT